MKILALADIHGRESVIYMVQELMGLYDFKAIFIAGDITDCGRGDAEHIIRALPGKVFAVPGNCDSPELLYLLEENGVSLHRRIVEWNGFLLVGLGGVSSGYTLGIKFREHEAFDFLRKCEKCVFLTHQPPYGILDNAAGKHIGSAGILEAVKAAKPVLVISGHVHEDRGSYFDGTTLFVNPGPAMHGYAAIIDLTTLDARMIGP